MNILTEVDGKAIVVDKAGNYMLYNLHGPSLYDINMDGGQMWTWDKNKTVLANQIYSRKKLVFKPEGGNVISFYLTLEFAINIQQFTSVQFIVGPLHAAYLEYFIIRVYFLLSKNRTISITNIQMNVYYMPYVNYKLKSRHSYNNLYLLNFTNRKNFKTIYYFLLHHRLLS